MEHEMVMVREYRTAQEFTTDEQKLGLEGWSVQSTVHHGGKKGLIENIRSRFSHEQSRLVVTYSRQRPS